LFFSFILIAALITATAAYADVSTFEDLTLGAESYWNSSDGSGGFTSGDAYFLNAYDSTYASWDGRAYSNTTDTTSPGWSNQYSAITGGRAYGAASPPDVSFGAVTGNDYNTTISGAYNPLSLSISFCPVKFKNCLDYKKRENFVKTS